MFFTKIAAGVVLILVTQCAAAANPDVHDALTPDELKGCEFLAETVHWLAKYREQLETQEKAVERYMTEARSAKVANPEMEKKLRAHVTGRAEIVYAVRSFVPITFNHFEFSICKMGILKHWLLDFDKVELITKEVEKCQAQFLNESSSELALCIDKVVFKFHQ